MNLYFECAMGAAGDMMASALADLSENPAEIAAELNSLGLPHTVIKISDAVQSGVAGAHLSVLIDGEEETPDAHHHMHNGRTLEDIHRLIGTLKVSDKVKQDIIRIYDIVAEAEAAAHIKAPGEIHFHELGMLDAIADITVTAYLIDKISPERILASPINVGNGTVLCAHGVLPVPAPATANILRGIPYYKSAVQSELCTPTGAALLKYYVDEFTENPRLPSVKGIGIGCGTKQFEQANIIRVYAFDSSASVTELACNIDDITGEEAAFAAERMMAAGALDCFITPIMMKKGRPAYLFTVLCTDSDAEKFAALIFQHTTTIGIRKYTPARYTLQREFKEDSGALIKRSSGYGCIKEKIEFEDIKAFALKENLSIFEARKRLQKNKG